MNTIVKNVAIVGAGLGGLATAIALRKQGIEVQIYDKAKNFRPAGVGLGLAPNGLRSLEAIEPDLVKNIKKLGCCVSTTILKNTAGEIIHRNPALFQDKYGYPLVTIWWWRLQEILALQLPPEIIHFGCRCLSFQQNPDGVKIHFENGQTANADLLVGADGFNSAVRKNLIGEEKPRYLNSLSWLAVVKNQNFLNPDEMVLVKGSNQFTYLLNLGDGNLSWMIRKLVPEYQVSSNDTDLKSRILNEIDDWAEPIKAIVKETNVEKILEKPICDRLPLKSWSEGRVVLLGDAAHPMAPAWGQGANTTFEDALVLAHSIVDSSTIEEAFKKYEKERIPRAQIIQTRSAEGEKLHYKKMDNSDRERTKITNNDFNDWLYAYKPAVNLTCNRSR